MEWQSPPAYTDDDRGSWNYPNYGLPKVLPLLLSTVVVLVTHAVRLAYYYKAHSNESSVLAEEIADLEGFLELSSDPNNDVFLGGLIADPGDFSEADPAVPLLLPGRWDGIRSILLDAAGPRDYTQAIAWQDPVMTGPTSIPQPAGRPPVNSIWNGRTGSWDPDPTNGPAEEVPEAAKRPRGPTPQGKQWCSSTARWVDKITGGDSHGEEVPEAAKRQAPPRTNASRKTVVLFNCKMGR